WGLVRKYFHHEKRQKCYRLRARKPIAWSHVPSQPLMRSPLSQFQTPIAPRGAVGFLRVWSFNRLPCRTDHPVYFGLVKISFSQPFCSGLFSGIIPDDDGTRPSDHNFYMVTFGSM